MTWLDNPVAKLPTKRESFPRSGAFLVVLYTERALSSASPKAPVLEYSSTAPDIYFRRLHFPYHLIYVAHSESPLIVQVCVIFSLWRKSRRHTIVNPAQVRRTQRLITNDSRNPQVSWWSWFFGQDRFRRTEIEFWVAQNSNFDYVGAY